MLSLGCSGAFVGLRKANIIWHACAASLAVQFNGKLNEQKLGALDGVPR